MRFCGCCCGGLISVSARARKHADGLARTRGMDEHLRAAPFSDKVALNRLTPISFTLFRSRSDGSSSRSHPGAISLNYLVTVGRRDEMAAAVAVTSSLPFWFFVRLIATGQRGRRISLHDALSEQQIVQVCGDYAARSVRLLREVGAPA